MIQVDPTEKQAALQLPGPDQVLLFLWRKLASGCDSLLFRYSTIYRRQLAIKRLTEFR